MVELTIVMNCGTGTYETKTFEDKKHLNVLYEMFKLATKQ